MAIEKPSRLPGTRIFLAGTQSDLSNPEIIEFLKKNRVTKVFCLYPLTPEQFSASGIQ